MEIFENISAPPSRDCRFIQAAQGRGAVCKMCWKKGGIHAPNQIIMYVKERMPTP
jgi:hypothetical protein